MAYNNSSTKNNQPVCNNFLIKNNQPYKIPKIPTNVYFDNISKKLTD